MAQSAPSLSATSAPTPAMMPKKSPSASAKPGERPMRNSYSRHAYSTRTTDVKKALVDGEDDKSSSNKLAAKLVPTLEPRSTVVPQRVVSNSKPKRGIVENAYVFYRGRHYHTLVNPATGYYEAKNLPQIQFDLSSLIKIEAESESEAPAKSQNRRVKKEAPAPAPAPKQGKKRR